MSQKDVNFIQKAAGGGAQEVANGKMAEKQAKSAGGEKHRRAHGVPIIRGLNNELTALANRKGVTFNTSGVKAQNLGSGDFDRLYLKWLEEVHRADIADFERAAKSSDDSELKAWASKTLPTLKQHLAMVQAAEKKRVHNNESVFRRARPAGRPLCLSGDICQPPLVLAHSALAVSRRRFPQGSGYSLRFDRQFDVHRALFLA